MCTPMTFHGVSPQVTNGLAEPIRLTGLPGRSCQVHSRVSGQQLHGEDFSYSILQDQNRLSAADRYEP